MEAIIWITAAVVIYLMGRKHCNEEKNHAEWKWKAYIAGSLLAAVLCEIGIKAVFHIHYLSIWLVLTYALIALQYSGSVVKTKIQAFYNEPISVAELGRCPR